jgi:hypothetical protein
MKKILIILFMLPLFVNVFSQKKIKPSKIISDKYNISEFIADSINYLKLKNTDCKWGVYLVIMKLNRKGEITLIRMQDSIPLNFKDELTEVIQKTSRTWSKSYIKKIGYRQKDLLVVPILNALISDCNDKYVATTKFRNIDSALEQALTMWQSVSKTAVNNLAGISETIKK